MGHKNHKQQFGKHMLWNFFNVSNKLRPVQVKSVLGNNLKIIDKKLLVVHQNHWQEEDKNNKEWSDVSPITIKGTFVP